MLFNSQVFVFGFLPAVLGGFFCLRSLFPGKAGPLLGWITISSLFFYSYWNPGYLLLLGASIVINFALGRVILSSGDPSSRRRWMQLGVLLNLAALGWFKYAGFLAVSSNSLLGTHLAIPSVILPLALSFITFQKIAFLVDCSRGQIERLDFLSFLFFVSFFPPLIAGPIVHYRELEPQTRESGFLRFDGERFRQGLLLFLIGLAKKLFLADPLALGVRASIGSAWGTGIYTFTAAWRLALSYTLQIYFDFSGYSNMAIGLALLFGLALPLNFDSPYQATSIIDFWKRWHITLSRFLRDYLYIPLGGNRSGKLKRYRNLFVTMLLGGLWHGAGWNFVLWGGLHGTALGINHAWRERRRGPVPSDSSPAHRLISWLATFLFVVFAWIPFRAESIEQATQIWRGMIGLNGGFAAPLSFDDYAWSPLYLLQQLDLPSYVAHLSVWNLLLTATGLGALILFCLKLPRAEKVAARLQPTFALGLVIGVFIFLFIQTGLIGTPSEFIYFHF